MPGTSLVQSLSRGLDILQAVAVSERGLRLGEMAKNLGLKAPTVHNLARTLVAKGFLDQSAEGSRYVLGHAVGDLAAAQANREILQRGAVVVRDLFAQLEGATITFAEASGAEIVVRLRMSPERPGVLEEPLGRTFQPYSNASGLVFQAYCSAEDRAAIRRRYPFTEYGVHLWRTVARLEAFLQTVREQGYAAPRFEGRNLLPVAAPIMNSAGSFFGTIGASAPAPAGTDVAAIDQELIRAVVEAAGKISQPEAATAGN